MKRRTPRDYPDTMPSAESGRMMTRGEKEMAVVVDGVRYPYMQPGWWCSLTDPDDVEGQLVDEDNQIADMAERTAKAIARGKTIFVPIVVRAIREACGLTQREAGEVFGTGAKSFEKYESGEITPSKPTERLLRLAMERPDLFRKPAPGKFPFPPAADAELIRRTLRDASMDRIYAPLLAAAQRKRTASPDVEPSP
jgi:HTH-type transcriptional regulator / antitoxin MqsA